jgi:SnoaL-like protein
VSAENVELIRSLQPRPEADLVALFADDAATARMAEALGHLLDPGFVSVFHFPGARPASYAGLDGMRSGWLDWLAPWASYRTEIERLIDLGECVVTVVRDYARHEPRAPEVDFLGATIWTVRDGRVIRVDFYAGGRAEGLASVGLAG